MSARYKVGDSVTAKVLDSRGRKINLTTLSDQERAKNKVCVGGGREDDAGCVCWCSRVLTRSLSRSRLQEMDSGNQEFTSGVGSGFSSPFASLASAKSKVGAGRK